MIVNSVIFLVLMGKRCPLFTHVTTAGGQMNTTKEEPARKWINRRKTAGEKWREVDS